MTTDAVGQRPPVVLSDPRAIQALAHPARLAVLDELFGGRELTATECAELVGLSPSAMSYHLRALARWGLVEQSDTSSDGRRRPWRAAGSSFRIETSSPAAASAEALLAETFIDRLRTEVVAWAARAVDDPVAWRDSGVLMNSSVWLTPAESDGLAEAVHALLAPFRARRSAAARPAGARRNRVAFIAVPNDAGATTRKRR